MTDIVELKKKRDGYVLLNKEDNVQVKCTEKFVTYWERMGFEVVAQKKIRLVS